MRDYYGILKLHEGDSSRKIYKAFKELAFPLHPEKAIRQFENDKKLFLSLCEAYYVLSSKENRHLYKALLEREGKDFSDDTDLKEMAEIIRKARKEGMEFYEMSFKEFKKSLPVERSVLSLILEIVFGILEAV